MRSQTDEFAPGAPLAKCGVFHRRVISVKCGDERQMQTPREGESFAGVQSEVCVHKPRPQSAQSPKRFIPRAQETESGFAKFSGEATSVDHQGFFARKRKSISFVTPANVVRIITEQVFRLCPNEGFRTFEKLSAKDQNGFQFPTSGTSCSASLSDGMLTKPSGGIATGTKRSS